MVVRWVNVTIRHAKCKKLTMFTSRSIFEKNKVHKNKGLLLIFDSRQHSMKIPFGTHTFKD